MERAEASDFDFAEMVRRAGMVEGTKGEREDLMRECAEAGLLKSPAFTEELKRVCTSVAPSDVELASPMDISDGYTRLAERCECDANTKAPCDVETDFIAGWPDKEGGWVTREPTRIEREHYANLEVTNEIVSMLNAKNTNYGRNLPRHGLRGVVIRISDKTMRLENLVLGEVRDGVGESIEDTLRDLAGYCIKALALKKLGDLSLDGHWKYTNGIKGFTHNATEASSWQEDASTACSPANNRPGQS
jgi:hypothetical protein